MLSKFDTFFSAAKQKYQTTIKKITDSIQIELSSKIQSVGSKLIKWKDGVTYAGECKGNIMEGKGQLMFANGDYYEGCFKDNNFHGLGKYYGQDGIYDGQWKNGAKCGEATEITKDGSKFKGRYHNGVKQGFGTFQWADGSYYEGMFKNDKMQGMGKLFNADGSCLQGEFKENSLNGKGKEYFSNGNVYIGFFQNGIKHGIGKMIHKDKKIEGIWQNGALSGQIIIQFNDETCKVAMIESNQIRQITDEHFQESRSQRQIQVNPGDLSL